MWIFRHPKIDKERPDTCYENCDMFSPQVSGRSSSWDLVMKRAYIPVCENCDMFSPQVSGRSSSWDLVM